MENEELDELIKQYIYESPDGGETVTRREIGDETHSKEYMSRSNKGPTVWVDTDDTFTISGYSADTLDVSSVYSSSTMSGTSITLDPNYGANDYDDIKIEVNGEVKSVSDLFNTVDAIKKRMAILEPKKEMLEKYKVLQDLYEQYKAAEALLDGPDPEEEE